MMREFELKDNITISLTSIQWVEDEKSETELITKAFYEKNKFGIDGERKFYYGGKNPEDAILMSRMV